MKLMPFEVLKALAVETRVKIIDLLKSKGPLGAKNIKTSRPCQEREERVLDTVCDR